MKMNHILLIDDNEIDNYINNHIIKVSNIAEKITVKNSAVDALNYLNKIKDDFVAYPELIFLDISMPIMDGFGFLDEFVKLPKPSGKKCSVIMLTSSDDHKDRKKAMDYDVVIDYFIKPLQDDLIRSLWNKNL